MMCLARDRSDQFEEHLPGEEDYRVLPAAHGRHERPVGTRLNYLATIEDRPDSQYEARLVLQSVADGADARTPENRDPAIEALDALDVSVACVAWNDAFTDDVFGTAGFEVGFALGPWTCWSR